MNTLLSQTSSSKSDVILINLFQTRLTFLVGVLFFSPFFFSCNTQLRTATGTRVVVPAKVPFRGTFFTGYTIVLLKQVTGMDTKTPEFLLDIFCFYLLLRNITFIPVDINNNN